MVSIRPASLKFKSSMAVRWRVQLTLLALLTFNAIGHAKSMDDFFHYGGQLRPEGRGAIGEMFKPALASMVGNADAITEPLIHRFMDSGYYLKANDWILFANPTYATVVVIPPKDRGDIVALSAAEIFEGAGIGRPQKISNLDIRFELLNKGAREWVLREERSPGTIEAELKKIRTGNRDIGSNAIGLFGPMLRSLNPDIQKCFNSISKSEVSNKAKAYLSKKFKETLTTPGFMSTDLLPINDEEAILILAEEKSKLINVFVKLVRRPDKTCELGDPVGQALQN